MSTTTSKESAGSFRFAADKRQLAGLMLVLGMCAIYQPLPNIAGLISPGMTATSGIPLWALVGGLCLVIIGILSMFIGYAQLVHDWGHKYLTAVLIVFTQTAFIPYCTDLSAVGMGATSGAAFIPAAYEPDPADVKFVGAMGILGILSYAFTFVGSISFMQFALFAFQCGNAQNRNASYYLGRKTFYTIMLFIAGFSQLLLGSVIEARFGNGGALDMGTIGVAMYVVNFPAINIFIGLLQVLAAVWSFARSWQFGIFGANDWSFQATMFALWFLQLVLQIIVQVSYTPADMLAPATTIITALSLGLHLMPAFLDFKARSVPAVISAEYYGMEETEKEDSEPKDDNDPEADV